MAHKTLILGTRASALALWQARHVQARLEARGYTVQLREITTKGDRILDVPLSEIGDKALFTKELDQALLEGSIHLAVHSLKDLPSKLPEGIVIGAVSEREEPWDAFVAHPSYPGDLSGLPQGAVLATSSLRRTAQLKAWRPDLEIVPVRGNVDTRLAKLDTGNWHGLVLAAAGLIRLSASSRIRERVSTAVMLPAVGQGALGITCSASDEHTCHVLKEVLHDEPTALAIQAERAFLHRLEGGCQVPVGAYAFLESGKLVLEGCVAALDGSTLYRERTEGAPAKAETLGVDLANLLIDHGAGEVLREIRASLNV
jgi:hydroxymethylbilane synthase